MRRVFLFLLLIIFLASCARENETRRPYPISSSLIAVDFEGPNKIRGVIKNPYNFALEATVVVKGYDENGRLVLVEDITNIMLEPYGHTIFNEDIRVDSNSDIVKLKVVGKGMKPVEIERQVVEENS